MLDMHSFFLGNHKIDSSAGTRYPEIDGIRGWAACIVILCHLVMLPFATIFPAINMPGLIFFNGGIAVAIFFVLSGDALSSSFFSNEDYRALGRLALRRYFRLTLPVIVSSATVYLLMVNRLTFNQEAAQVTHNSHFALYLPQQPDFLGLASYSFVHVYTQLITTYEKFLASLPHAYNPVFWTMSIELSGSALVFLILFTLARLRYFPTILCLLSLLMFMLMAAYAGFFWGILLAYLRKQKSFEPLLFNPLWQVINSILIALIVIALTFTTQMSLPRDTAVGITLITLLYTNRYALAFFRSAPSLFLGRLSFPLYAMHFPVLVSLTSWLIVQFCHDGSIALWAVGLIVSLSIMVTLIGAWLLYRLEVPYLKFIRQQSLRLLPA